MPGSRGRVAVVYPHLPHYRYGVFAELDGQLADVVFIAGRQSKDATIAVTPLGSFRHEVYLRNHWFGPLLWQRGLLGKLHQLKPSTVIYLGDVAHASTWVSAAVDRVLGRRVLFWTIGWHRPERGLKRLVRMTFYKLAHQLLLYGHVGQAIGQSLGYPRDRTTVIYNSFASMADSHEVPLSAANMPPPDRKVVGAVIRLSPNKGLDALLRAVAALNQKYHLQTACLIVGEGPERGRLTDLAAELRIELYLPGAAYSVSTLRKVYEVLDVTVVPKAAGLTVLQSLNEGTPVVTLRDPHQQMPEFEAIVDGKTGSLVGSTEPDEIAEACAHWLGRLAEEGGQLRRDIRDSVATHWSPAAQASKILGAIDGGTNRALKS